MRNAIYKEWLRIAYAETAENRRHEEKLESLKNALHLLQCKCPHENIRYAIGAFVEDSGYDCKDCHRQLPTQSEECKTIEWSDGRIEKVGKQ